LRSIYRHLTVIAFFAQCESDHEQLVAKINKISKIVANMKGGDSVSDLLKELIDYEDIMKQHLFQEEVECLPLCRAYFTSGEVSTVVKEIFAKSAKCETGSFVNTSKCYSSISEC
jgi:hemerythrin-like domain-containing protein